MKLATIETVIDVMPHPNADRLDICKVLGWQIVTRRGEFKAGDNAVFVSIDTILPRAPWSEFLADKDKPDKPIRLRTVKLRGQYSQGLLLSLSVLGNSKTWHVGADVSGELGIKKYEKEIPLALSGIALGKFPEYLVARTDEDNGLSNLDIVDYVLKNDVYVTQKLDGSSCTIVIEDCRIAKVCSRNLELKESDTNAFWCAAKALNLSHDTPDIVIQGELMGPGIQGNQLNLLAPRVYIFNIFDNFAPLEYKAMLDIVDSLGAAIVPLINASPTTLEECQQLADAQVLPDGKPAEGIVVRINPPQIFGNGRVAGFKVINRNYVDT